LFSPNRKFFILAREQRDFEDSNTYTERKNRRKIANMSERPQNIGIKAIELYFPSQVGFI